MQVGKTLEKKAKIYFLIEVNFVSQCVCVCSGCVSVFYVAAFYAALNFYNDAYYVNESF